MFRRLDRYLIAESVWLFAGFLALASSILLIERMVRLTEIVRGAENPAFDAVRLILRLLPHYFELALPGALLLTTIMTVNRLSRNGEITAILTSGVSLYRVARPFAVAAVILATLSILSSGYLKPLTRYNFRAMVSEIGQDNIIRAFRDQQFIQVDNWTIWTDALAPDGITLGPTFVLEVPEDGAERFMVGASGALRETAEGWVITLNDAMIGAVPDPPIAGGRAHQALVRQMDWRVTTGPAMFRARGLDERELTLSELLSQSYTENGYDLDPRIAMADLHDRLVRALVLVSLAVAGFVMGLNPQRRPRSGGLIYGIVLLLAIQKVLEFGLLKAQQGAIPAWAGSWPVLAVVTAVAFLLFHRANGGHRPPRRPARRFALRPALATSS